MTESLEEIILDLDRGTVYVDYISNSDFRESVVIATELKPTIEIHSFPFLFSNWTQSDAICS